MTDRQDLRDIVEELSLLDRSPCSPGARRAAERIATELAASGAHAEVQRERVHGSYWWPLGITSLAGMVAAVLGRRHHRLLGGALGAAAGAAAADDMSAGRRWLRAVLPKQTACNVVATAGDEDAGDVLILVAHHDCAHSGMFHHPRVSTAVGQRFPPPDGVLPRQLPAMVPIALAPALSGLAALLGLRRLALGAAAACAGVIASFADIGFREPVPGANDNLSGVATLIGVARQLEQKPVRGLRVLLVSTDAEEALMAGMTAFMRRHLGTLFDPDRTRVLCVDTVGSPHLVLAEAEGIVRVRDYDAEFKQLIFRTAQDENVTLHRGVRMRYGTDGYLALRRGIPAAMLMSLGDHGSPSNYHLPTDTAENVVYERLADTVRVCEAVIRRLAEPPVAPVTADPA